MPNIYEKIEEKLKQDDINGALAVLKTIGPCSSYCRLIQPIKNVLHTNLETALTFTSALVTYITSDKAAPKPDKYDLKTHGDYDDYTTFFITRLAIEISQRDSMYEFPDNFLTLFDKMTEFQKTNFLQRVSRYTLERPCLAAFFDRHKDHNITTDESIISNMVQSVDKEERLRDYIFSSYGSPAQEIENLAENAAGTDAKKNRCTLS